MAAIFLQDLCLDRTLRFDGTFLSSQFSSQEDIESNCPGINEDEH